MERDTKCDVAGRCEEGQKGEGGGFRMARCCAGAPVQDSHQGAQWGSETTHSLMRNFHRNSQNTYRSAVILVRPSLDGSI